VLVPNQTVQPPGRSNYDMRTGIRILDQVNILLNRRAAVKNSRPNFRHILAESRVFIPDLKGEFTGVTKNENRDFSVHGLDLLEGRKDKDGRFTETRFGLTEDIG